MSAPIINYIFFSVFGVFLLLLLCSGFRAWCAKSIEIDRADKEGVSLKFYAESIRSFMTFLLVLGIFISLPEFPTPKQMVFLSNLFINSGYCFIICVLFFYLILSCIQFIYLSFLGVVEIFISSTSKDGLKIIQKFFEENPKLKILKEVLYLISVLYTTLVLAGGLSLLHLVTTKLLKPLENIETTPAQSKSSSETRIIAKP